MPYSKIYSHRQTHTDTNTPRDSRTHSQTHTHTKYTDIDTQDTHSHARTHFLCYFEALVNDNKVPLSENVQGVKEGKDWAGRGCSIKLWLVG